MRQRPTLEATSEDVTLQKQGDGTPDVLARLLTQVVNGVGVSEGSESKTASVK